MFLNSIKQLLRRPGKALIFFLLLAAATALLTFAAVSMTETNQRIDAAESQFSTVATVSQLLEPGNQLMTADMLNFEGAEYVSPPETRPYYLARTLDARDNIIHYKRYAKSVHIVEFTPIDDSISKSQSEPMKVRIDKVHYEEFDYENQTFVGNWNERRLEPGDEVYIIQTYANAPNRFEAGKTYMGNLDFQRNESIETGLDVFSPLNPPYSTLYDPVTHQREDTIFPETSEPWYRCDEITGDFWEPGGLGDAWMEWIEQIQLWDRNWLPVIPTNDVQLLPTFHAKNAYIDSGREITPEEFTGGAKVCMISDAVALSGVRVGDKINLSMQMALYGYRPDYYDTFEFSNGFTPFKPLDAQGKPLQAFFEEEYEVVGIYRQVYADYGELYGEAVIVPSKSITATDENNIVYYSTMNDWSTSFRIPNGKIAEFNTALHNAVPGAARLEIIYDDNGYEQVMQSLKNARLSSILLLAVGVLAALTIIVLLMYFFVVKERKRTAIERSLGLSKRQCRVSLMSGVLALAVPAVVLGSWMSWALTNVELAGKRPAAAPADSVTEPEVGDMSFTEPEESMETAYFSRDYSLWAQNENSEADIVLDEAAVSVQELLYLTVPAGIFLAVLMLAAAMVNGNLRIEPILLLGGQSE